MRTALVLALMCYATTLHAQNRSPRWQRVIGDNGAVIAIDLNSIWRSKPDVVGRRIANATICVLENDACNIDNEDRWIFYCTFNRIASGSMPSIYVSPQSLGRRVLDIACGQ